MLKAPHPPTPTQVETTRAVVAWYLRVHRASDDLGLPAMFFLQERVGSFAVNEQRFYEGDGEALGRVLIATTMFQRRQDQQILRILRGMSPERVEELTSLPALSEAAERAGCAQLRSLDALLSGCDLDKDAATKRGICKANPELPCPLKSHTEWLKRYGHFGKVPTSVALAVNAHGAKDLAELYQVACARGEDRVATALWIEEALCAAWRVSDKIAAMFLSAASNPDLSSLALRSCSYGHHHDAGTKPTPHRPTNAQAQHSARSSKLLSFRWSMRSPNDASSTW